MAEKLNDKHSTLHEILNAAAKSTDPVATLREYIRKDSRVNTVLGYALNPRFRMPLPDGVPPYIPSQHPIGVAPVEILNTHNKLYVMYSKDTKQFKKEEIFVQWLEDMAPEEAELMLHIKDQTLDKAIPGLTLRTFIDALGWEHEQYQKMSGRTVD
jgi:hypothetical protein